MKLALLGADDATLAIARRVLEQDGHQIVLLTEQDLTGQELESMGRLRALLPQRVAEIGWESVLDGRVVDAVLVARGEDQELRADQLRKLVQAAIPLLISHPVLDSMLVCYELDMIRRESGCIMLSDMPWRWHPAAAQLAQLIGLGEESPIGDVGQATFERTLRCRDKPTVLAQFARDIDLIRATCGDATRLSALGSPDESTYANLGVQMSGLGSVVVRWSVSPIEDSPRGSLTVVGSRGKAVLHMPEGNAWRLEVRSDGLSETESFLKWDPAEAALEELTAALEGNPPRVDWCEAARAIELAETIDRSLVKGRTIELHNEDFTDIGTFKGTMTSLGCGLLLVGLCAMLGMGIVEAISRKLGFVQLADALRFWPYWLVGFLVVFLLLQLVLKLAAPGDANKPGDRP